MRDSPSRWTTQCACRVIPVPRLLGSQDLLLMELQGLWKVTCWGGLLVWASSWKNTAQPGHSFASWGSEAPLRSLCVEPGVKSNVSRGIQTPASLWGGAGAGQQDVTLGPSPADEGGLGRDRVWDDTQTEGQGLLWLPGMDS